jgi:hypothetical protein
MLIFSEVLRQLISRLFPKMLGDACAALTSLLFPFFSVIKYHAFHSLELHRGINACWLKAAVGIGASCGGAHEAGSMVKNCRARDLTAAEAADCGACAQRP